MNSPKRDNTAASPARPLSELIDQISESEDFIVNSSADWSDLFDMRYGEWPKNWSKLTPTS